VITVDAIRVTENSLNGSYNKHNEGRPRLWCLEDVENYLPQAKVDGTRQEQLIKELTSLLK
jgi:hypothetical protein